MPAYRHTQTAPMWPILIAFAPLLVAGALGSGNSDLLTVLLAVAAAFLLMAVCFHSLTVEDEGQHLRVRFGPLPLFRRRFAYGDMTAIAVGRSKLIDGLGIHYIPNRGWTYNLWGFDCVELCYRGRILRIGTDDAKNLASFLQSRTQARN